MNWMVLLIGLIAIQPDSLTLNEAYNRAREHYPKTDQLELQRKITDLRLKTINTDLLPQVNVNAQASYQSAVTELPINIPGQNVPSLDKDQYKVTAEVNQLLYGGGAVDRRKDLEKIDGAINRQSVEVELHTVRQRVDQVYFSILLLQKQAQSVEWLQKNLDARLKEVASAVKHGALKPGVRYQLKAERLESEQKLIELQQQVEAARGILGELTGRNYPDDTRLVVPDTRAPQSVLNDTLPRMRPEYALFRKSRQKLGAQQELIDANKLPKVSLFATTGYGKPGLNFLKNEFEPYYVVGVRAQWNFWNWFNASREKHALQLEQDRITTNQHAFTQKMRTEEIQLRNDMQKWQRLIDRDQSIVKLREKKLGESASALVNGTITASDYMDDLTATQRARLSLETHRLQLIQTNIQYQTQLGLSWNR